MWQRSFETILKEREEAIYFAVINVVLIRHVIYSNETDAWETMEGFLKFKDFHKKKQTKKTGSDIAEMIEKVLSDKGIDIGHCRGQYYDNRTNVACRIKFRC